MENDLIVTIARGTGFVMAASILVFGIAIEVDIGDMHTKGKIKLVVTP